jgi:hypothetical protein
MNFFGSYIKVTLMLDEHLVSLLGALTIRMGSPFLFG